MLYNLFARDYKICAKDYRQGRHILNLTFKAIQTINNPVFFYFFKKREL